jgi:hypothetical protein
MTATFIVDVKALMFNFMKKLLHITKVGIIRRLRISIKDMLSDEVFYFTQFHKKVFGNEIEDAMIVKVYLSNSERLLISLKLSLGTQHPIFVLLRAYLVKGEPLTIEPSIPDICTAH